MDLTVFVNDSTGLHSVWTTHGFQNKTWIQARVDYNASGVHQVRQPASLYSVLLICCNHGRNILFCLKVLKWNFAISALF